MNTYLLILKSHCEAPDFEIEIEAENKYEAVRKLQSGDSYFCDWDGDVLLSNMEAIND